VWRGVADAPAWPRLLGATACGLIAAVLFMNRAAVSPLLSLTLASLPIIPVWLGIIPILLVFQGPVILIMAGAAVSLVLYRSGLLHALASARLRATPLVLFVVATLIYMSLGAFLPGPAGPQGDEPHYLAMTHSLISDADLDLTDEFEAHEYRAFFAGRLAPHASSASPPERIYSIHAPGLPVLILPAYAIAGYTGVRLFLGLLASLAAVLTWRYVRDVSGSEELALAAWAALVLTPPLPFFAVAVYPELPAALATALLLNTSRGRGKGWALPVAAATSAVLPWLHTKFLPLALLGLGLTLWNGGHGRRAAVGAVTLFGLSVAGLLAYFQSFYGAASLSAAYGSGFDADVSVLRIPWGAPALLFDRQFGLFAISPIWILTLPGVALLWKRDRVDAFRALALGAATFGVGASFSMWWGGACPPARFVVPALPAATLSMALGLRARPRVAALLGGIGVVIVGLAAAAPRSIHNQPNGDSGLLRFLAPTLDLSASLPSFVIGGAEAVVGTGVLILVLLVAWRYGLRAFWLASAVSLALAVSVRQMPLVAARASGLALLSVWDEDNLMGPTLDFGRITIPVDMRHSPWQLAADDNRTSRRLDLPAGRYGLRVDGRVTTGAPTAHVVRLDVIAKPLLLARDYLQAGAPAPHLELTLPVGARRLRIAARGIQGSGRVDSITVSPIALLPRRHRGAFPWPRRPRREHYRIGATVRATPLETVRVDGEGFRIEGTTGTFAVEAPRGTSVNVRLTPLRARVGDQLLWGGRRLRLGKAAASLQLPADEGFPLGDTMLIPVRIDSEGAWIGFFPSESSPSRANAP
jgi:hypothetical protein